MPFAKRCDGPRAASGGPRQATAPSREDARAFRGRVPLRGGACGVPPWFTAKFAAQNTVETTSCPVSPVSCAANRCTSAASELLKANARVRSCGVVALRSFLDSRGGLVLPLGREYFDVPRKYIKSGGPQRHFASDVGGRHVVADA